MTKNARNAYLEGEVLQADPVRLVCILYRLALDAVGAARRNLRTGDRAGRGSAINRASAVINELALSVKHEDSGELSRNLVELYDYMQRLLQQANFHQTEPPLEEAERLLQSLLSAWEGIETGGTHSATPTVSTCPSLSCTY